MSAPSWAQTLLDFVALLRRNGIVVTTGELSDALTAVELLGPGAGPAAMVAALQATLTKTPDDAATLAQLFALFFAGFPGEASVPGNNAKAGAQPATEVAVRAVAALAADAPALARSIAGGQRAQTAIALRTAARASGLDHLDQPWQEGFLQYRLLQQLDIDTVRAAIGTAAEHLAASDQAAADWLISQQRRFDSDAREFVRTLIRQRDLHARKRFLRNTLLEQNFRRATPADLQRMRQEVQRLAQQLKTRVVLRRKANRRGTLHVATTMRANLATDAIPFKLKRRHRGRRRPELVLLVDVSESVRAASEFFLLFVYSLQDLFTRVRSFGFVSDVDELTELFYGRTFAAAFAELSRRPGPRLVGHSDYGRAFAAFATRYGDAVSPRSTLIVLGDARSNYQPHRPELVRALARRARYSIWLNPEPRSSWGLGDSVMPDYADAFHLTASVANLRQLEHMVRHLVLPA